jgi:hypothetical protein
MKLKIILIILLILKKQVVSLSFYLILKENFTNYYYLKLIQVLKMMIQYLHRLELLLIQQLNHMQQFELIYAQQQPLI